MSGHAVLAPSHAETWFNCEGSPALCAQHELVNTGSVYADEGTAAHAVGSAWLLNEPAALAAAKVELRKFYDNEDDFDDAMENVEAYVEFVRNASEGQILMVEQRVGVGKWTTEVGGKGTSDAIVVNPTAKKIKVIDLKFGQGNIVFADNNKQEMLYGLGALELVEMIYGQMDEIELIIFQPRRDHVSTFTITREALMAYGAECQRKGATALSLLKAVKEKRPAAVENYLHPSDEACLWCPAKKADKCPALKKLVQDTAFEEFNTADEGEVSVITRKIESDLDVPTDSTLTLIEDWCKAKREYIDGRLRAGVKLKGWKLVLGKKGARKFTDLDKILELLKSLKFKKSQIYVEKMIPLTKVEKLVPKPKWPVFEKFITQADPRPTAVSDKDPRPEYQPTVNVENFDNIEEEQKYDLFV
jgi:hypothetical protein